MTVRKVATALAVVCAAVLAVPVAAGAQTTQTTHATSFNSVPVTGKASNGKTFTGRYMVTQFVTRHGKPYAVGTLTGKIGNRTVKSTNVSLPAQIPHTAAAGVAAACPILHLTLGPLKLNLLGLTVHLNQVVLDITAHSGPGNLLGNLLCSVAGLLDQNTVLSQQLAGLLNIFQQLGNTPGLLNL
ncbi:MAG TPA: hypothetical protein VGL51_02705 [Solirubrobacteraceae bacterium]|jgi:uncharacterized low-complexity protein